MPLLYEGCRKDYHNTWSSVSIGQIRYASVENERNNYMNRRISLIYTAISVCASFILIPGITTFAESTIGWVDMYREILEEYLDTEEESFWIADLNGDDIPELLLTDACSESYHDGMVQIYTFDGDAVDLGRFGSWNSVQVIKDQGIIIDTYTEAGGDGGTSYYQIDDSSNGHLRFLFRVNQELGSNGEFVRKLADENGDDIPGISDEEAESALSQYDGAFVVRYAVQDSMSTQDDPDAETMLPVTEDNITNALSMMGYDQTSGDTDYSDSDDGDIIDEGDCGSSLYWKIDAAGTLTIYGTGEMRDYRVSDEPPWYWYSQDIKNIVFEEGITHIGSCALSGLKYTSLSCELKIPEGVTSIGDDAFLETNGFYGTLQFPDSLTYIGDFAFQKTNFEGDLIIPDSVTYIGLYAFSECADLDGELHLPASLQSVKEGAFYECSGLCGTLTIPDSVQEIGYISFAGDSGFTGDLIIPPHVTSIDDKAFSRCSGFNGKLSLPDSLTYMGDRVFSNCTSLSGDVIIPDSVRQIGDNAFYNCTGLSSVSPDRWSYTWTFYTPFDTSVYDPVLESYRKIYSADVTTNDMADMDVNTDVYSVRSKSASLQYAYVDLLQNDHPLLVISEKDPDAEGGYSVVDICLYQDSSFGQDIVHLRASDNSSLYLLKNKCIYAYAVTGDDCYSCDIYWISSQTSDSDLFFYRAEGFLADDGEYSYYSDGDYTSCSLSYGQQMLEYYGLSGDLKEDDYYSDLIGWDVTDQCVDDIDWTPLAP